MNCVSRVSQYKRGGSTHIKTRISAPLIRLTANDQTPGRAAIWRYGSSALTGFEPTIGFVDNIGAATAADHAVIAVPVLERL
jgi:hypothetical protein